MVILFWSAFVVVLGKDTSWDFRNYHWYAPYAFLNHRMGFDVAVAHQASYYNPFLDIPYYWLATHTRSWVALVVLGAAQGANVVPLYLIARSALLPEHSRLQAGRGRTGAAGPVWCADPLRIRHHLLRQCDERVRVRGPRHPGGEPRRAEGWPATARRPPRRGGGVHHRHGDGTEAAGDAVLRRLRGGAGGAGRRMETWRQGLRLLAGGIGGAIGFGIFAAPWMLYMWHLTGNPLFPYFNEYWHSSLALAAPYRDLRFVPTHFWREVFFPILFSIDWHVADDLGFQDIRVCIAYLLIIAAGGVWLARRESGDPLIDKRAALVLFAWSAVTYFVWMKMFAIYRYVVALEMLAPLLIVAAVGLFPVARRTRYSVLGVLCFAVLVTARSDFLEKAPVDDPYVQVALPPIPHPDHTMVVMTGDAPMGFIAPALPPRIPILRIDGWMVQPRDGTVITRDMKRRVAQHLASGGDLYLIADRDDMVRARDALADYRLAIRWTECQQFDTNLVGIYQWCPLARRT